MNKKLAHSIFILLVLSMIFMPYIQCSDKDEPSKEGEYYRIMHFDTNASFGETIVPVRDMDGNIIFQENSLYSIDYFPPNEAVLEMERNGEMLPITPQIYFYPVPGADDYHIQLALDPEFTDIVKDSTQFSLLKGAVRSNTDTEEQEEVVVLVVYTPKVYLAKGKYYWRVRAHFPEITCDNGDENCQPQEPGYGPFSYNPDDEENPGSLLSFESTRNSWCFSYPVIGEFGPFTVGTYGPMMALGFLFGLLLLRREFRRKGYHDDLAYNIAFAAIVGGIVGAKLLSIFEQLGEPGFDFWDQLFSGGGLTWYGGFIGGAVVSMAVIFFSKRYNFWGVVDSVSIVLPLGYSFGRMGCQLSADGCFGEPTNFIFGITYPPQFAQANFFHDIQKTISIPDMGSESVLFPLLYAHPTPLYEIVFNVAVFAILWFFIRQRKFPNGVIFSFFLILTAIPRYFVEFIRRNEIVVGPNTGSFHFEIQEFFFGDMAISQLIAVISFGLGLLMIAALMLKRKSLPIDNADIEGRKKVLAEMAKQKKESEKKSGKGKSSKKEK